MAAIEFTESDIGKAVVTSDGSHVGLISAYRHGTAYVDPEPGIRTKITAALGWESIDDEDGYPLQEAAVATITDDEVRLRSDLSVTHD